MILLISILAFYCLTLLLLEVGWNQAIRIKEPVETNYEPLISVIVAVRNEAKNLPRLISSLSRQRYGNFEIIFIDDHSTDNSFGILNEYPSTNIKVLKNEGEGKKSAITTGIRMAKGSIVATTDADCIVPDTWLNEIRFCFLNKKTQLAFGGVRMMRTRNFFSVLQSMEFASLIGSGASTAALGFPSMCNGANLAYRKSVFESVNGYEGNFKVASGDDEFLMRKIDARFPGSIRFLNSPSAIVETEPHSGLSEFFLQRLRWAGKWKYNSSFFVKALAIFILVSQMATLMSITALLILFNPILLTSLVLKVILEALFLLTVCRWMKIKWSWAAFISLQFFYPVYVIVVGVASNFVFPSWKDRPI